MRNNIKSEDIKTWKDVLALGLPLLLLVLVVGLIGGGSTQLTPSFTKIFQDSWNEATK